MKKLNIKFTFTNVEDEDFDFLISNGLTINEDIKQFLKNYGGKKIVENCFSFGETYYIISMVLPIKINQNPSIELILPALRDIDEGIGRNDLVPFGIDPGGNPFYVSIGKLDYSNVYLDRMSSGYDSPILKIADTFEQFIEGLQPEQ